MSEVVVKDYYVFPEEAERSMKLFGVFPLDDLDDFKNLIQSEMKSFA